MNTLTSVTCPQCSVTIEIEGESHDLSGQSFICPECNTSIILPDIPIPTRSRLTFAKRCPKCDIDMGNDAVFCVNCGHDTRPTTHTTNRTRPYHDNRSSKGGKWVIKAISMACIIFTSAIGYSMYSSYVEKGCGIAIDSANSSPSLEESIKILQAFSSKHPSHPAANMAKLLLEEQTTIFQTIQTAIKQSEASQFDDAVLKLTETVNIYGNSPKIQEAKTCLVNILQLQSDFQTRKYELALLKVKEAERKQQEAALSRRKIETAQREREIANRNKQQEIERERDRYQSELEKWNQQQAALQRAANLRAQKNQEEEAEAEARRAKYLSQKLHGKAAPAARNVAKKGSRWGNCPKCGLPYKTKYIEKTALQEFTDKIDHGEFAGMDSQIPFCPRCSK